jgi:Protein of unknown function (DUF3301)
MTPLFVLLLIAMLTWFWYDTMRARERAVRAGKQRCEQEGLQLLDETVALCALRLRRNGSGRLALRRVYAFEFSDNGNNRRAGSVTLLGGNVESLYLEPYLIQ